MKGHPWFAIAQYNAMVELSRPLIEMFAGGGTTDPEIMALMSARGVTGNRLNQALIQHMETDITVAYRILKREKLSKCMGELMQKIISRAGQPEFAFSRATGSLLIRRSLGCRRGQQAAGGIPMPQLWRPLAWTDVYTTNRSRRQKSSRQDDHDSIEFAEKLKAGRNHARCDITGVPKAT
jgi:hypothetical protein